MNPERLLENNALPFAGVTLADDHRGFECALAIAKLAWRVTKEGTAHIAEPQREIRLSPTLYGGAGTSVKYPSDRFTEKPGTEVILVGRAFPPRGDKVVSHLDVSVRVESGTQTVKKAVRVFGKRVWTKKMMSVAPGPPAPIQEPIPLEYELAKGGVDPRHDTDEKGRDPVNPVGVGHRVDPNTLIGEPAHQLEPIEGAAPAGFGAIHRHWSPRKELYGTIDDTYYRRRHPIPPKDFDVRYNCDGHPDLWCATPLQGDEPIEIVNATPEGAWRFRLPLYKPRFDVLFDGEWSERETKLDSILIDLLDVEERILELTWRCCVRLPKKSERLETIRITNAIDVARSYYDELFRPAPHESHSGDGAEHAPH
jgi:hypothetical protein